MTMDELADLGERILKMNPMPDGFFRVLSEDEEGSFRKWSRDNYIIGDEISGVWHPVTRDECHKMNSEAGVEENVRYFDFISRTIVKAKTEAEARGIFYDDIHNFVAKAECEDITDRAKSEGQVI